MCNHHTRKPSMASAGGYAGDIHSSRGATSITNAARIGLTLYGATAADVERYNIPDDDVNRYVRLDDAKMNLTLMNGDPVWLRKETVRLLNGDEVGSLMPATLKENAVGVANQMARTLLLHMQHIGTGGLTLVEATTALQSADPLFSKLPFDTVKSRVMKFLAKPINVDGALVRLVTDTSGSRRNVRITIE
jgi:hypothetical protein